MLLSSNRGRKLHPCSRPQAYIHLNSFHLSLLICLIWFRPAFPIFSSLLLPKIINFIISTFSSCVSPSYYPNCRLNTASSASFWKKEQRCLWQNASWLPNCLTVEGDVGDHTQTQSASQGLWAATRAQMHRLDTHLQVRSMGENITKLQVTVMESTAVSCYRSKDECVFPCLFHACL